MPAVPTSSDYDARNLLVLEGLDAVRKRPGMYVGSTDTRGLMHCIWELIDNSVDEALAGVGTEIVATLGADGSIMVADRGRGIPVDAEPKTGLSGLEVVLTKLHAGGKFGGGSYNAAGGLHGVGLSVVNALAARLDVEVDRNSATWAMSFKRGDPGTFAGPGPDAKFSAASGIRKAGKARRGLTGTRIKFWPDPQIFLPSARLSLDDLRVRARETSFLVPGLKMVITDERGGGTAAGPVTEEFQHHGGIVELCEYLAPDEPVTEVVRLAGSDRFVETVPMLDPAGHMTPTDVERNLEVEIGCRWGAGYETIVASYVNVINTAKGGTHVAGFERALTRTLVRALEGTRLVKAGDEILKEDVQEGLTAVVSVKLAEPQFEGQTKQVLGTPAVSKIVARIVEQELTQWLGSSGRAAKAQSRLLLEKVVSASRARVAARQHKDAQRRRTALAASALPAKLVDCRSADVTQSELFIVEGDSALGTAKLARDSEYQALLPIRGKILNVQKASVGDMLKNAECASIIQVVGAGSGRTFDLDASRYGKIIFMADADSDGAHIRCLLATLFFRYMRPLVESGRVFTAVPPLHRFELIQPRKGTDKYVYTYSEVEYQRKLAELTKRGVRFSEPQRYKGLGEMDADQLAETTMDPRRRSLRRLQVDDAADAEATFEVLMGSEVAPRKEFIIDGAYALDQSLIDA